MSKTNSQSSATAAALLETAEGSLLDQPSVAALAEAPSKRLIEALGQAIDQGRIHAATALALAIGAGGGKVPRNLAFKLIPDIENTELVLPVLGIVAGNRLETILDLLADERLSWEREAMMLFVATQLLEGSAPPRALLTRLRLLARESTSSPAKMVVGLAARELRDPELDSIAASFEPLTRSASRSGVGEMFRSSYFSPVLDSLPERAHRMISGYTFVRSDAKVGRNDPCPCGSGKKYKKCCSDKEDILPAASSRIERLKAVEAREGLISQRDFDGIRPSELAQLDPTKLTTIQLITGMRKLSYHHRWEVAEQYMDVLATREDAPSSPGDYRGEFIHEALSGGALDLAARQLEIADLPEGEKEQHQLELALARKEPDALARLESRLLAGHEGNFDRIMGAVYALLDHSPALGILAARGSISADRFFDSEMLLMEIDRARDRLGLPAHEPWWEIFDLLLDNRLESPPSSRRAAPDEGRRVEKELDQTRERLRAANSRVSDLDRELAERIDQLDAITAERERLAEMVESTHAGENERRVVELEEERARLRTKVEALKGEIREGASRRAELRRELAKAADERHEKPQPAAPDPSVADQFDDSEGDAADGPNRILVPEVGSTARRALREVPSRVAASALEQIGLLSGGDDHAWSDVKHMRRLHDILSTRIGRSWRLLFRIDDSRLEVIDLVNRGDLETTINRLTGR